MKGENYEKLIKRVSTIQDLCGVGKAELTNVIPVLATLGIEACPIQTMVLTKHTGGFTPNVIKLDGYISNAAKHYRKIDFEGIFIGYLGSTTNIEETLNSRSGVKIFKCPMNSIETAIKSN